MTRKAAISVAAVMATLALAAAYNEIPLAHAAPAHDRTFARGTARTRRRKCSPVHRLGTAEVGLKVRAVVAQVFNLPYRRLPVGRRSECRGVGGLQIRDTADCKSALQPAA
jgi:hypothetical protein